MAPTDSQARITTKLAEAREAREVLQGSAVPCRWRRTILVALKPSTVTQLGMPPRTTLTARWCALADFKTIAEQIVANWPKLTTAQSSLIGSVMTNGAGDGR